MNLIEYITTTIESLRGNKIRSFLTMLGIIIGVANVILVVAVLQGGRNLILDEFGGLGSNLIYVSTSPDIETAVSLTEEKIKAMSQLPQIVDISPEVYLSTQIRIGKKEKSIWIMGTLPSFKEIERIKVLKGRGFLSTDLEFQRKVCVIGNKIAKELFKEKEPIGKEIRIKEINFKVIGVMQEKRLFGFEKFVGDTFYVPFTTAQKVLLDTKDIYTALIRVKDTHQMDNVILKVKEFLKKRHDGKELFTVESVEEIISTIKMVTSIIALVIGCIAGISLLVGGIGIMNIMLVSVRERTREIGIRKAIGAKNKEILIQFLVESSILSLIGGIIGIIIGLLGANIIALLAELPFLVTWQPVVLGFVISFGVGVIFGVYPAKCASALTPVEALRYE